MMESVYRYNKNEEKEMGFEIYAKNQDGDILVKVFTADGNYSIASKLDPEPLGYLAQPDHDLRGWELISVARATEILGYDPTE